jgi:hypothetical protein
VFAEPKVRRRTRASSRDGVWRKSNPKARDDEQEPDMRCGALGTSWHVTAKSPFRNWGAFYKSGVYVLKALCFTPGGLHVVREGELGLEKSGLIGVQESAEGIVGCGNELATGRNPGVAAGGLIELKARTVPVKGSNEREQSFRNENW